MPLIGRNKEGLLAEETREIIRRYIGLPEQHFLESCVDCAACAPSCPFYEAVDKRYSPVRKAERMRRLYRAVGTLSGALLGRLVGASLPRSEEEVEEIYEVAYRCTNCGSCYYVCPHGIDSGRVISMLRGVLTLHGKVPPTLNVLAHLEALILKGKAAEAIEKWREKVRGLSVRHKVEPLGRGEYLLLLDIHSVFVDYKYVDDYLKVLDAAGISYSLPDRPLGVRPPISLTIGLFDTAREVMELIYDYAVQNGYDNIVILDGGYPYNDLKYFYTYIRARKPRNLEIMHVAQLIHDTYIEMGVPAFKRWGRAAYIPSCNIDTRGGLPAGTRLVEATAAVYDKHFIWPYSGAGWLCMLCPQTRLMYREGVGLDLILETVEFEDKITEDLKKIGWHLGDLAVKTSTGYHVFSCSEDITAIKASGHPEANPIHLSTWLAEHL